MSITGDLLDAVATRRLNGPPMSAADEQIIDWLVGIICLTAGDHEEQP